MYSHVNSGDKLNRRGTVLSPYKWRKYLLIARTSLQNNMAYTANFFFDSLFYAFIVFIFLQLWKTVYGQGGNIAGYSLSQMIWYCIVTELVVLSGSNVFWELNNDIKGGNVAYLLNKPYNFIFYQLSDAIGLTVVKVGINSLVGVLLGLLYVGPLTGFEISALPYIIMAIGGGLFLNFFILTALGLTAFWLEENTAFFWIYQKLVFMLGLFLPVEFFPKWLSKLAAALPFSYITYGPAKLVVDFSWVKFRQIVSMQLIYLVGFFLLSLVIYRKGVRGLNVNGG